MCTPQCIEKLKPFTKDIEKIASLRTSINRPKNSSLATNIQKYSQRTNYKKKLHKLLKIAYISDQILSTQKRVLHKQNRTLRKMAEKLLLVSPDFIEQILKKLGQTQQSPAQTNMQQEIRPPPQQNLALANETNNALKDMESGSASYDNEKYNKTLGKHLGHLDAYEKKMIDPRSGPDGSQQLQAKASNNVNNHPNLSLLNAIPPRFAKNARNLHDFIMNSKGRIGIADNNEAVLDGEPINNSNVYDYIQYLVGTKSKNPKLPGLFRFVKILRELGFPKSMVADKSRLNILETGEVSSELDPLLNANEKKPAQTGTMKKLKHQPDPIEPFVTKKKKRKGKKGQSGKGGIIKTKYKTTKPQEYRQFTRWLKKVNNF